MNKENPVAENKRESVSESTSEKLPKDILKEVDGNAIEEEKSLKAVEMSIGNGNKEGFQKEASERGIIGNLSEKIKKNKLLRAALIGFSLYSASPSLAAEIPELLKGNQNGTEKAEESESGFDLKSNLDQFKNMPEEYKKQLEAVFSGASDEKKKIIQQILKGESDSDEENIIDSSEDVDLLKIQQQIIDLQNKGEMAPSHKKVELPDGTYVENGAEQKITIESASENQIRAWIDSLKDSEKAKEEAKSFNEKNKEGWQNIYPERNPAAQDK